MIQAAQSTVFVDGNNVMGSRPDGWWRDRAEAGVERRLGLAERLADCIRDWRDPALVVHTLPAMLRLWTPPVMQANS